MGFLHLGQEGGGAFFGMYDHAGSRDGPSLKKTGAVGGKVYRWGPVPIHLNSIIQVRDSCPEAQCPEAQCPEVQCPDFNSGHRTRL